MASCDLQPRSRPSAVVARRRWHSRGGARAAPRTWTLSPRGAMAEQLPPLKTERAGGSSAALDEQAAGDWCARSTRPGPCFRGAGSTPAQGALLSSRGRCTHQAISRLHLPHSAKEVAKGLPPLGRPVVTYALHTRASRRAPLARARLAWPVCPHRACPPPDMQGQQAAAWSCGSPWATRRAGSLSGGGRAGWWMWTCPRWRTRRAAPCAWVRRPRLAAPPPRRHRQYLLPGCAALAWQRRRRGGTASVVLVQRAQKSGA